MSKIAKRKNMMSSRAVWSVLLGGVVACGLLALGVSNATAGSTEAASTSAPAPSSGEVDAAPSPSETQEALTPTEFTNWEGIPRTDGPVATTEPDVPSISHGEPVTEDQVLGILKSDSVEFQRIDQLFAKTRTIGEIRDLLDGLPEGWSDDQMVIVGTAVGEFLPSYGKDGKVLKWGSIVVSATNGKVVGSFALNGEVPDNIR